jgi:hypothetical protein
VLSIDYVSKKGLVKFKGDCTGQTAYSVRFNGVAAITGELVISVRCDCILVLGVRLRIKGAWRGASGISCDVITHQWTPHIG